MEEKETYLKLKNEYGYWVAYNEFYLKSHHWFELKKVTLEQHPACHICKLDKELVIHHLSYRHLFEEEYEKDIIVICNKCHGLAHNKYEQKPKYKSKKHNKKRKVNKFKEKLKKEALENKKFQYYHLTREEAAKNKISELVWQRRKRNRLKSS